MSGKHWFSTDLEKGLSRVYNNSHIETFVDAEDYYCDLRKEVEATGQGGQICWIGFEAHGATPMPVATPPRTLKPLPPRAPVAGSDVSWLDVLTAASTDRKVPIRALLNLHPKPDMNPAANKKYKASNFDLVEALNKLGTCLAINDFRYLWLNGTHHQKLVLVYSAKGLMAYVGTCDVERARIENGWCEVHCKIIGDVAAELYDVFGTRWSEHTSLLERERSTGNGHLKPVSDMKFRAPVSGNFLMQTSTTYGNPARANPFNLFLAGQPREQVVNAPHRVFVHTFSNLANAALVVAGAPVYVGNDFFTGKDPKGVPLVREAAKQARTYAFAPTGHTGIYEAIRHAITATKQYIYLEDQYLVNDDRMGKNAALLELLVDKLGDRAFKKLIVLTTRIDDINDEFQGTGWAHRNRFVSALKNAGNDRVSVCQYRSRGSLDSSFGERHQGAFYVHSKTWIFDDEFLITGSANCNRRGYSHDSELDVGIYDQDKRVIKDLRVKLWKSRLNTQGIRDAPLQDSALADFMSAAKYWDTPKQFGLTIESDREVGLEPRKYHDLDLASYKATVTGAPRNLESDIRRWIDAVKMRGLWDLVVDPDGS